MTLRKVSLLLALTAMIACQTSTYTPGVETTEEKVLIIYPSDYIYENLTISNIEISGIELTYNLDIDGEEENYNKLIIQVLNDTGDILGYFPVYQNINEEKPKYKKIYCKCFCHGG